MFMQILCNLWIIYRVDATLQYNLFKFYAVLMQVLCMLCQIYERFMHTSCTLNANIMQPFCNLNAF